MKWVSHYSALPNLLSFELGSGPRRCDKSDSAMSRAPHKKMMVLEFNRSVNHVAMGTLKITRELGGLCQPVSSSSDIGSFQVIRLQDAIDENNSITHI